MDGVHTLDVMWGKPESRVMCDPVYVMFKWDRTLQVTSGYFNGTTGSCLERAWGRFLGNRRCSKCWSGNGCMEVYICTNSLRYTFKIYAFHIM